MCSGLKKGRFLCSARTCGVLAVSTLASSAAGEPNTQAAVTTSQPKTHNPGLCRERTASGGQHAHMPSTSTHELSVSGRSAMPTIHPAAVKLKKIGEDNIVISEGLFLGFKGSLNMASNTCMSFTLPQHMCESPNPA